MTANASGGPPGEAIRDAIPPRQVMLAAIREAAQPSGIFRAQAVVQKLALKSIRLSADAVREFVFAQMDVRVDGWSLNATQLRALGGEVTDARPGADGSATARQVLPATRPVTGPVEEAREEIGRLLSRSASRRFGDLVDAVSGISAEGVVTAVDVVRILNNNPEFRQLKDDSWALANPEAREADAEAQTLNSSNSSELSREARRRRSRVRQQLTQLLSGGSPIRLYDLEKSVLDVAEGIEPRQILEILQNDSDFELRGYKSWTLSSRGARRFSQFAASSSPARSTSPLSTRSQARHPRHPPPPPATADQVFCSASGDCYHERLDCNRLQGGQALSRMERRYSGNIYPMSLRKAKNLGRVACLGCYGSTPSGRRIVHSR